MERLYREWETKDLKRALEELRAKAKLGGLGDAAELMPVIGMVEQELKRRKEYRELEADVMRRISKK